MKTLGMQNTDVFCCSFCSAHLEPSICIFCFHFTKSSLIFIYLFFACSHHILGEGVLDVVPPNLRFPDLKTKVDIYFFSNLLAFWGRKEEAERHWRRTLWVSHLSVKSPRFINTYLIKRTITFTISQSHLQLCLLFPFVLEQFSLGCKIGVAL